MKLNPSGLLVACILGAGCSGSAPVVTVTLSDPAHPLPSRPADAPVRVFSVQPQQCPYDEIGTVRAAGGGPLPSRELTLAVQRDARHIGGDAIVVATRGSTATALTATVIRFRDANCAR